MAEQMSPGPPHPCRALSPASSPLPADPVCPSCRAQLGGTSQVVCWRLLWASVHLCRHTAMPLFYLSPGNSSKLGTGFVYFHISKSTTGLGTEQNSGTFVGWLNWRLSCWSPNPSWVLAGRSPPLSSRGQRSPSQTPSPYRPPEAHVVWAIGVSSQVGRSDSSS